MTSAPMTDRQRLQSIRVQVDVAHAALQRAQRLAYGQAPFVPAGLLGVAFAAGYERGGFDADPESRCPDDAPPTWDEWLTQAQAKGELP